MNKKKAVICTSLFAMVLIGVVIGTMFIESEYLNLYKLFANTVVISWVYKRIENFYYWLTEE